MYLLNCIVPFSNAACKLSFPGGSAGKESTCNAGDQGSKPGLGRSPGEGKGYPLQYSGLEKSINCIVHGVAKSWTQLSDFHFTSALYWVEACILLRKLKMGCTAMDQETGVEIGNKLC